MPFWPVNHNMPRASNVAVLRLARGRSWGSGKTLTSSVAGSTRTIALSPPSVIQGAPSGPTITPCGAEPEPSLTSCVSPVEGLSQPSSPDPCAVNQTPPLGAAATSCGRVPAGTGYSCTTGSAVAAVGAVVAGAVGGAAVAAMVAVAGEMVGGASVAGALVGAVVARAFGADAAGAPVLGWAACWDWLSQAV